LRGVERCVESFMGTEQPLTKEFQAIGGVLSAEVKSACRAASARCQAQCAFEKKVEK
jgi:hypothetical protein